MESFNSRNYLEIELTDSIVLIDDLNSDSDGDKVDKISDSDKVYHSCCVHSRNNQMEDDDDNNNDGPGASETLSVAFNERGTPDGKSDADSEDLVRSESLDSEVNEVEKEETGEKSEPDDYEEEVDVKEEDEDEDFEEKETEEEEIADEDEDEVEVEEVQVQVEVEAEAEEDKAEEDEDEEEEEEMGEIAQMGNGISLETVGLLDDFEAEYEEPMEQVQEHEQSQPPSPTTEEEEEEPFNEMNGKTLIVNQYLENNPLIATGISDDQVSLLTKHSNYKRHVIQLNSESSTLCSASPAGSISSSRSIYKRLSKSSGIKAFKSFHKKITKLFK